MTMTAKDHLEKAAAIVNGDRQRDYGHPRNNHSCTADLFNAYMDRRGVARLDAQDVCVFNILQKLSRFANRRTDDSVTDIIGYALNIAMCGDATDTPGNTDAAPREVADTTPALSDPPADTTGALCGEWPKRRGTSTYQPQMEQDQGWVYDSERLGFFGEAAVADGERLAGVGQ